MHMSHKLLADWLSRQRQPVAPRCSPSPSHLEAINPGRARRTNPTDLEKFELRLIWLGPGDPPDFTTSSRPVRRQFGAYRV